MVFLWWHDLQSMSTELDIRLVPRVLTLVKKYGQQATFKLPLLKEYDRETGKARDVQPTDYVGYVTPPSPFEVKPKDGDNILSGDLKTYLAAKDLEFTPAVGMKVVLADETEWVAVSVGRIYTGVEVALWVLQLRR